MLPQLAYIPSPAKVVVMPKARLPHEFAPVSPETLREAEDARRYGDPVVIDPAGRASLVTHQIIHMPVRARKVPFATLVEASVYIEDGFKLYGRAAIVRAICSELAAEGHNVTTMTLDDLAQIQEEQ
jgi:hypothetical protein